MAWNLERVRAPWDENRPSIYEFIAGHLDDTGSLGVEPPALPDEASDVTQALRLPPTSADTADEEIATEITGAVYRLARRSTNRRAADLYRAIDRADILDHTNRAFPYIQNAGSKPATIRAIGRWLATCAPDRSAVVFGMVLLGMVKPIDTEVMLTLGAHEEFTFVAAVALRTSSLGERGVFELARRTHGIGRVHALEQLAGTRDPDIRRWILEDGFRSESGADYLALACAISGDLAEALAADDVDDTLLDSAGEMLAAIVDGRMRPTEYPDLVTALAAYLDHVTGRNGTEHHRRSVATIRRYLDHAVDLDIDEHHRARLVTSAAAILDSPGPETDALEPGAST